MEKKNRNPAIHSIRLTGYIPGAIGRIVELHASYYSRHWGFGLYFESKVALDLAEFLNRLNDSRDGFWVAVANHKIIGSIAIDGIKAGSDGAHLRWFILDPEYRGYGYGNVLLKEAIGFCRGRNIHRVYLWTFEGLDAARRPSVLFPALA